jgi:IS5 family transposase
LELSQIIDVCHRWVKLAETVDWDRLDVLFGATYSPDQGRPAISTRLMVSLHYLKYMHNLSDEDVLYGWVENPRWQYLGGMKFFRHSLPIDPSSMTRRRTRMGEAGAKELLKETIEAGLKLKVVKPSQLARINVDTTVQEKNIRFATDARLYDRTRERLVQAAQKWGITLRQSYSFDNRSILSRSSGAMPMPVR